MRIAICEDELYWSELLLKAVERWGASREIEINAVCFATPDSLLQHLASHVLISVLFLDISLGQEVVDGLSLAQRIRQTGNCIPIIFVTSNIQRAAEGYLVEAAGFLEKPLDEDKLAIFMDRIVRKDQREKSICLESGGRITQVFQNEIVYVEIINHAVLYHTIDRDIETRGSLREVLNLLPRDSFVQIHRSYVIALAYIDSIKTTHPHSVDLLKQGDRVCLAVSRKYINGLIDAYSNRMWEILP